MTTTRGTAIKGVDPASVLRFWFEQTPASQWFNAGPQFDAKIRRRFAPLVFALAELDDIRGHDWLEGADRTLALILALDQFPRNIWRGTAKAFSLDPLALEAARIALAEGHDLTVDAVRRPFFYLPFMHSEDLEDQQLCVSLSETRIGPDSETTRHARGHRDVIARFGRFPHRNRALDRLSTASEIAFLNGGGYAPGAPDPANSA